jgi:hypothetical protein
MFKREADLLKYMETGDLCCESKSLSWDAYMVGLEGDNPAVTAIKKCHKEDSLLVIIGALDLSIIYLQQPVTRA